MSNVQECIDLYLTDEHVTDLWFRAMLRAALENDVEGGVSVSPLAEVREQLKVVTDGLVLLNRVDGARREQVEALRRELDRLTAFVDPLVGRVRVLRERLDNLEGK